MSQTVGTTTPRLARTKACLAHLLASLFFALAAGTAVAQLPAVTVQGLPAEPLIGEEFCADISFQNTGGATGFGPYLVLVTDAGISDISADFVDITPRIEQIGVFDATGELLDPISGRIITGAPGGSAWLLRYPVGSVDPASPALVMSVCADVEPGAEIAVPLDFEVLAGFEFGDTTVGTNGPIIEDPVVSTVTPQLARLTKSNSAPESENPPGPSHPFDYTWSIDISEGVTLDSLVLRDALPASIQWTGDPIVVNAPLGTGCSVSESPNADPTPGGVAEVSCTSVLGTTNAVDVSVTLSVYIVDILDEASADPASLIQNTLTLDYDYQGNPFGEVANSSLTAEPATLQKTVSGTGLPGGRLSYAMNFQLTDYPAGAGEGADSFLISDVIPDGLDYLSTLALVINGTTIPIAPSVSPGPGAGETTLIWDVAAAAGGVLPNGARGSLSFDTQIREFYANGDPVQASDPLVNSNPTLTYGLTAGGSGSNASSATASIQPNVADKTIASPNPVPDVLIPGTEVVFELSLSIPAGKTSDVVFTDFLPRPVFDVGDFDAGADLEILPPFASLNPTVTTNAGNNSVRMEFGDLSTGIATTLRVRLAARIVGTPFADDLFLTNLLGTAYRNRDGDLIEDLQAAGGTVGAPSLVITKGIIATDNPSAVISPAPPGNPRAETADSNVNGVDASDQITYLLTVENVGSTPAFNVIIDEPLVADLSCAEPAVGDLVNGNGAALSFSGSLAAGIALDDPLRENDGSEGAPYAADTALLTLRCTLAADVEPLQTISNEAGVVWTSTADPSLPFTRVSDTADAVIATPRITKRVAVITPGYNGNLQEAHIGELVTYELIVTVPEGSSSSVRLEDVLPNGMAFVDVLSITGAPGLSTSIGSFNDVIANAGFNAQGGGVTSPDRRLVFGPASNASGFGTVSNANSDNSVDEELIVVYRARVLNAAVNTSGQRRRNRASWLWQTPGDSRNRVEARARPVDIVEARLQLRKTLNPDDGDNSTPPRVTLVLNHAGGSAADAFDTTLADDLPPDLRIAGPVDFSQCSTPPDSFFPTPADLAGNPTRFDATWSEFSLGSQCTIAFDTSFIVSPPAGREYENCAQTEWESLRNIDQPLAQPPNNTLGVERTGSDADPGQLNNYRLESCDSFRVFGVGISKDILSTDQAHTDGIPGTPADAESLTIGETAVFELVVTIPETNVTQLVISDLLPVTDNVLELISARTTFVGGDLSPGNANPTAVLRDRDNDGINDEAELDFGFVGKNDFNGTIDDQDRIRIEVVAKVRDVIVNRNDDITSNSALARFPNIVDSDAFTLEIVEPLLALSKTADRSEAEAGDTVLYTIRVEHSPASRIDAKDVTLEDTIPAALNAIGPSVLVGGNCSAAPDTGPVIVGGVFSASWDTFPLGAVCELEFQAQVDISAVIGQVIVNTSEVEWTSLDTQGDADDRDYQLSDSFTLNISEPGLGKIISDTDVDSTALDVGATSQELTIGETATFTIVIDLPDGTIEDVAVFDRVPTGSVAMDITRAQLVSIGADLTIGGGQIEGANGADCSPGGSLLQSCAEWALGTIINVPDSRPDEDAEDRLVFEIDAIVLDSPLNSGAPAEDKNLQNVAELQSSTLDLFASTGFDLVEPQLDITKLTENGALPATVVASEIKRFTLTIDHRAESTATALDLVIVDSLNTDTNWVDDSTATSDCPNFQVAVSPGPGGAGPVEFSVDSLSVAERGCTISYDVQARGAGFPTPATFPNTASLLWESAPGSSESRQGNSADQNRLVSQSTATISKVVTGTSVPGTAANAIDPLLDDLAIGERINYRLVVSLNEGLQTNVVVTDTLQEDAATGPILEFISASVISLGDNITARLTPPDPLPPLFSESGNVLTFNLGSVENLPDGVLNADDTIVIEVVAQVVDQPGNTAGTVLTNLAELDVGGVAIPETASVDIEVVEPDISASKSFVDVTEGVATIELAVTNSGNAAGYELIITDEFDETFWLPGTLTPVTVPPGFNLSESSAGGITTVTLETRGNPSRPEEVLAPGETVSVSFSMTLIDEGVPGVTQIDNTANAEVTSLPGIDPDERRYDAVATDSLLFPELALSKTWSGPNTPARPGDTLRYTLTLTNSGLAPATEIVITDTPDPIAALLNGSVTGAGGTVTTGNTAGDTSIAVSFASVAAGSSVVVEYDVLVPLPYPDSATPQSLTNQATADSKEQRSILSDDPAAPDPDNPDPTVVAIAADPILRVGKDPQTASTAPGATIAYRIDYLNVGDQDASGVVLSETVPANTRFNAADSSSGWSCPDASVAGTVCTLLLGDLSLTPGSVTFAVDIDSPVPAGVDSIANTVDITDDGAEFDPNEAVVPSTDSASTNTPLDGALPLLRIEKDDGGISVAPTPGQSEFGYLIEYANVGNQDATGVVITETVPDDVIFSATASTPSWSCPDGSPPGTVCSFVVPLLSAQSSAQATFGLVVVFPAAAGRERIVNTVTIEDDGSNSAVPASDSDSDDTPLIALPDIYVNKTPDVNVVSEGDSILYTAVYGNQGTQNATGVVVREAVPAGAVFNASNSAPTSWSCGNGAPAGTICEYQGGAVNVGFMETLFFAIDIIETPDDREIVNLIEANDDGSNGPEPTPGNNLDRVVTPFPSLNIDTMSRSALLLLSLLVLLVGLRRRGAMQG